MKSTLGLVTLVVLLTAPVILMVFIGANSVALPDYEVKVLLDPARVLDANNQLTREVIHFFGIAKPKEGMRVQYLDTPNLDINAQGWNVRLRKLESHRADKFELTYKKRYAIAHGNIEEALAVAASDGFEASEADYEPEVDWGFQKQTLSFGYDKILNVKGYKDKEMLSLNDSRALAIKYAPDKFKPWGVELLKNARIYGPVDMERWKGKWQNRTITVEIWKINKEGQPQNDYVVEASFKSMDQPASARYKEQLEQEMNQKGWLLPIDALKTQMILHLE